MNTQFEDIIQKPEILINGNEEMSNFFLDMTSAFFESTKENEFEPNSSGKNSKLFTKNFGQHSIWEQIKLQNKNLMNSISKLDFTVKKMEFEKNEEEEFEIEEDFEIEENELNENINLFEEEEEEKEIFDDFDKNSKGIESIHISDENFKEEEEELGDINKSFNEEEKNKDGQIKYEDFFGDEPPEDEFKGKIREIEKSLIDPKPWHLMGEAKASDRPKDSLADIDIDFDINSSLPPNPLTTNELETLLIKRIESMNFDDVIRKKKPITNNNSQLYQLNGIKSTKSLVDEYAEELIKQNKEYLDQEQTLTQQQKEAIDMWKSLEQELNRFTEKRFIAKRPKTKIEISSGAILNVESQPEPTKTPEEIMKHISNTRDMKGELEHTHEEKKSQRRQRKEKDQKQKIIKDAEKGILYSQNGKDGSEIQIKKDIEKLEKGQLQGIEIYIPGEKIPEKNQKTNFKKNYLL